VCQATVSSLSGTLGGHLYGPRNKAVHNRSSVRYTLASRNAKMEIVATKLERYRGREGKKGRNGFLQEISTFLSAALVDCGKRIK